MAVGFSRPAGHTALDIGEPVRPRPNSECPERIRNLTPENFVCPDKKTPGAVSKLVREQNLSGTPLLCGVMGEFGCSYGVVEPTVAKPIINYPMNVEENQARGGVEVLKTSIKNRGWLPHLCTSRAHFIDCHWFWYAIGGGKRSVASQELLAEKHNLTEEERKRLEDFPPRFEAVIYSYELAYDGEAAHLIMEQANSTNKVCQGLLVTQRLSRAGEHFRKHPLEFSNNI